MSDKKLVSTKTNVDEKVEKREDVSNFYQNIFKAVYIKIWGFRSYIYVLIKENTVSAALNVYT